MLNRYSELVVTIPGEGTKTLFRTNKHSKCLSERCNRSLRRYKGRKVNVVDVVCSRVKKMGWFIPMGGRHV